MASSGRNGVFIKVAGVVSGVALLAILGLSFSNQSALAKHNSANAGPHGTINTDIASMKRDLEWFRMYLSVPPRMEEDHE